MKIGKIFKAARLAKGFTLRQVEDKTAISNAYLSQLENEKITAPSAKTLNTLCNLYDISVDELFNGRKQQPESQWSELNIYIHMLNDHEKEDVLKYIQFVISKRNES